jgi:hypothetical protein
MNIRRAFSIALFLLLCCVAGVFSQSRPEINQVSPDHVLAGAANTPIIVYGKNLGSGSNVIVFNGTSLSTTAISANELTATIPSTSLEAIGSFSIYAGTTTLSNRLTFRVLSPLLPIVSYTPAQFTNPVNTPVAVFGSNFDSASTILFDWQPLTTTFISSSELTATIPSGLITGSQTHHILVFGGAFTAGSIGTISNLTVIGSDQPQVSLSNVVIGTSMNGTATVRALQGTVTLSTPFKSISGPNAGDFAVTGGSCANAKTLAAGSSCTAQVTATPAAFPAAPPGWLPNNSYALNFEIVDNGNGVPNAVPHIQKATTAGTSGAITGALHDAGTGYVAGDGFALDGTAGGATGHVTSVGGGGAVTGIALDSTFNLYSVGNFTTTDTSGVGAGLTVDILTVAGPWNESGGTTAEGPDTLVWTDQGPYAVSVSETATLTINSNAANNPQSIPLSMTKTVPATGAADLLAGSSLLNPDGFDFGTVVQSTPTIRAITLENDGRAFMELSSPFFTLTGTNAADFALSGGTCADAKFLNNGAGGVNNPGQACGFNLTFTPSTTAAESATLTLNWTSIGGSVGSSTQALTGTGHSAATKISLSWTASTSGSVTGYKVYRGTQSGGPYTLLASLGNVTSYDDTTVTHPHTYCYTITAIGSNPPYATTESSFTAESCGTF